MLTQVAPALKTIIKRPNDLLARYAGEEFIIALPDTEEATSAAYLWPQVVRDLKISDEFLQAAAIITVSADLKTCIPNSNVGLIMFIESTDKALYAPRENGRNRAAWFTA